MNPLERAAIDRLLRLRLGAGWVFQPVTVDGELELVTGWRAWPSGWTDAVAIRDVGDAKAYRCDPAGGEVWDREGSTAEVLDELIQLPAPGEPGAPTLVKARRPTLWKPGS